MLLTVAGSGPAAPRTTPTPLPTATQARSCWAAAETAGTAIEGKAQLPEGIALLVAQARAQLLRPAVRSRT
jgi:hypothetical protein